MLSKEEVKHISTLARIGMSDEDLERFSHDLTAILDWVKQLEEVDTEGAVPMSQVAGVSNISRDDVSGEFSNKAGIVGLFPEEKSGYDKVKSVL